MRRPLLTMGGLFVLGEAACRMWMERSYLAYLMVIIAGLVMGFAPKLKKIKMAFGNNYAFENKKSVCLLLFLCFLSGIVWNVGYELTTDDRNLSKYCDMEEDVFITAGISWIEPSDSGQWLLLKTGNTKILAYVSDEDITEVCDSPGKYLEIRGRLEELKEATNPGAFDMRNYYEGKNIRYRVVINHMKKVEVEVGILGRCRNRMLRMLYGLRKEMAARIDEMYTEESAAILKTMLLGDKSSLSNETRVLYQRCGIAHVLAISGLHVALIGGAFGWILKKLGIRRRIASGLVIGFVFIYALMTGMSAPTLRAAIMLSIGEMAFIFGRTPDMPTTSIEALLIITVISPGSITSPGIMMSYSAVAGIICSDAFYSRLFGRERFVMLPERLRGVCKNLIRTILMATSINAFMLPLVMRSYYEVPLFSMVLNWIVIPLLTVIVAAGFASVVLGSVGELLSAGALDDVFSTGGFSSSDFSRGDFSVGIIDRITVGIEKGIRYVEIVPVSICRASLTIYKWLCRLFLKIPGGVFSTGHIEIWQMVVMYAVIIVIILVVYVKCGEVKKNELNKSRKLYESFRWVSIYSLSIFVVLMLSMNLVRVYNIYSSKIVFLDVGQGDGSIIHLSPMETESSVADKHGKNYIVDCGSTSVKDIGKYALIPALKYYAMTDIDCIFISHTDLDHISGIIYLIDNAELYGIRIKHLALATGTDEEEANYQRIKIAVDEYNKDNKIYEVGGKEDSKQSNKQSMSNLDMIGLRKGDIIDDRFEVLYPSGKEEIEHSGNDYSLVLKFISDDYEILYTGDIGADAEQKIIQDVFGESNKRERILKVAHHGSKYSSCEEFIDSYSPDIAVISVGEKNTYGHPSEQTLAKFRRKGVTVYRTDRHGAVIIE